MAGRLTRKLITVLLVASCLLLGTKAQLLGGTQETSDTTVDQAVENIMSVPEFATVDRKESLRQIFKNAVLVKTFSQVVAGINRTFLLKTVRGFECFKVYNSFTGESTLIRYARGKDQNVVLEDCRSFTNMKEPLEVARSVFAAGN